MNRRDQRRTKKNDLQSLLAKQLAGTGFHAEEPVLSPEPCDIPPDFAPCRPLPKTYAGFTLMELVLTMAIMGILAAIAIPVYLDYTKESKNDKAKEDIKALEFCIVVYQADNGRFPSSLSELDCGNLIDPWGNPYQYLNIADDHPSKGKMRKDRFLVPINSDYDLYSMGADGKSVAPLTSKLSQDDIVRANNGGYLGLGGNY
jgi:general secretion pathway protein G